MALDIVIAVRHNEGEVASVANGDMGIAPADGTDSFFALSLNRKSKSGIGMSTGHTSLHAPQSDEAVGRSANSGKRLPKRIGESTAPTGPP